VQVNSRPTIARGTPLLVGARCRSCLGLDQQEVGLPVLESCICGKIAGDNKSVHLSPKV
jgi:hypothetical protein